MSIHNRSVLLPSIAVAGLLASALLYIAAIAPRSFGFYHDDSIYVATAKSLATGQGYRIISLPGEPVQTKSPPLHPFLLSLIWRAYPQFPENLTAMMLLSGLATLASLVVTWIYLTRQGYASSWQALAVVGLTALNWRTVVVAAGIYSEMFYTAIAIGGLHLAEEYEKKRTGWISGLFLGTVVGLAFLTRTSGIAVLMAVTAYYVLRRHWRRAVLPVAVGSVFVLAWMAWGHFNRPTIGGVNAAYYESYFQTLRDVVGDLQVQDGLTKLQVIFKIVGTNILMFVLITAPLMCFGLPYDWPQRVGESFLIPGLVCLLIVLILMVMGFLRQCLGRLRLLHVYVIAYLSLHLIWPYSGYDRFLMPLLPFLLLFVISEFEAVGRLVLKEVKAQELGLKSAAAALVGSLSILIVVGAIYNYGSGIYKALGSSEGSYATRALEDAEAIEWINEHTDISDVLVCYRDPLYYLYTGRKATRSSPLKEGGRLQGGHGNLEEQAKRIFRIIEENNARYLILTSSDLELEFQADLYQEAYRALLTQKPHVFEQVFESADGRALIYRIHKDGERSNGD